MKRPDITNWSFRAGRFVGVDVYVHFTFLLLLAFVGFAHWLVWRDFQAPLMGILFTGCLFVCVLLHEFGHALAAARFGIRTRDITLLPIGGIARLERIPEKPVQEFIIAIAGPVVNVIIAGGLFAGLWFCGAWEPLSSVGTTRGNFLERLVLSNLFLVAFNLIPAFPMDGGRVFRSLLSLQVGHVRATRIASGLGRGIALAFGFAGLFTNPLLMLIALFVWIGATQEASAVERRAAFDGVSVQEAMLTQFETLPAHLNIADAARKLLDVSQQDFPVLERNQVVGILSRDALIEALKHGRLDACVSEVMHSNFQVARPGDSLAEVISLSAPEKPTAVPVIRNGHMVGLLTPENIGELYMIKAALQRQGSFSRGKTVDESTFTKPVDIPPLSRPVVSALHE